MPREISSNPRREKGANESSCREWCGRRYTPTVQIELLRGDVASLKVDAIVNPRLANKNDGVEPYSRPAEVATGNLLCKFVIDTVLPPPGDDDCERRLHETTWSALRRAEELALRSIAFPPCHTLAGLSSDRCARAMMAAAFDFAPQARSVQHVVFCAFSETTYASLQRAYEELQH